MKGNDKTPKKGEDEKKSSKQTPGSNSSGGGTSSTGYSTPATSKKFFYSPITPYSPPGESLRSETRSNKARADSPDCIDERTISDFLGISTLEERYSSFHDKYGSGVPFLLRELGLRLLYNTDAYEFYSSLISSASYISDFTHDLTANIDYAHQLFAIIRNNHRYHKSFIKSKQGLLDYKKQEVAFRDEIKVKESWESPLYKSSYLETIRHEVHYDNSSGYSSYNLIQEYAQELFTTDFVITLKESFKLILSGKPVSDKLTHTQKQFIYKLFYHIFVIEGARDPSSFLTIPMAIEYLAYLEAQNNNSAQLLGDSGVIPICFKDAMRSFSYMGDIVFIDGFSTSIQYSYAYNGTIDRVDRSGPWNSILQRSINLFQKWQQEMVGYLGNDFKTILYHLLQLSQEWYGFMPRIHESDNIQLFGELGMQAQNVEYDGNCFFHALNRLLYDLGINTLDGVEITPDMLRQRAANGFHDPMMRARVVQNGRWLDINFEEIADILANLLHVNIVIVPADLNQDAIENIAEGHVHIGDADHPNNTIYIGNINNVHFVSLTSIPDNEMFHALQQAITDTIAAEQQPVQVVDVQSGLSTMNTLAAALTDIENHEADEESSSSDEHQEESDEDVSSEAENDDQDDEESESNESTNSAMEWIEENGYEAEFQLFEQRVADNAAATNYASQYESLAHAYRACCEGDVDEDEEHALIAAYNGQYDNSDHDSENDEYEDSEVAPNLWSRIKQPFLNIAQNYLVSNNLL